MHLSDPLMLGTPNHSEQAVADHPNPNHSVMIMCRLRGGLLRFAFLSFFLTVLHLFLHQLVPPACIDGTSLSNRHKIIKLLQPWPAEACQLLQQRLQPYVAELVGALP